MYTKFIIVVDEDINVRRWEDVIWAMTTRMDPVRDITLIENTPIDYLDFASPVTGDELSCLTMLADEYISGHEAIDLRATSSLAIDDSAFVAAREDPDSGTT